MSLVDRTNAVRLIALAAAATLVAACGGAENRAAPGTPSNPMVAKPTEGTTTGRSNEGAGSAGEQPGYQKLVERQTSNPSSRFTPCELVTRTQARAILGAPVLAPQEAPQGPTCIYRTRTGSAFVTLAVQRQDIRTLKRQLRQPEAVDVSNRVAYCGNYGQQVLYVELSGGRVLSVAAPCKVARQFARKAVAQASGR
jgi:hypothetical protein